MAFTGYLKVSFLHVFVSAFLFVLCGGIKTSPLHKCNVAIISVLWDCSLQSFCILLFPFVSFIYHSESNILTGILIPLLTSACFIFLWTKWYVAGLFIVPRLFEEKRRDTVFGFPWCVVRGSEFIVGTLSP